MMTLPSSIRDTFLDDAYSSLSAVVLFALAVAAAAAFLGPAARPPLPLAVRSLPQTKSDSSTSSSTTNLAAAEAAGPGGRAS